jgi:hypothetical protein
MFGLRLSAPQTTSVAAVTALVVFLTMLQSPFAQVMIAYCVMLAQQRGQRTSGG